MPNPPKGTSKPSALSPNAFDGQMLLMDMFLGNVVFPKQRLPSRPNRNLQKYSNNVPLSHFSNINQIMSLNIAAAQDFIHSLTPLEYAQIYPSIALSVINTAGSGFNPVYLPLSKNADLDISKLRQGNAHYSTNSFGLKSLEMFLDGNDHPFFSKAYVVSMEFIFDSMNTFTSDIPGLPGVSYARLLKSAGRVGELSLALKLDIGYSSNNKEIVEKYALHSPEMAFSLFLHFQRSTVAVKENLQVSVKAEYISREEKVFDSVQLYDILALDISAAQKKYENVIDNADLKLEALAVAEEKILQASKAELQGEISKLSSELSRLKTKRVHIESDIFTEENRPSTAGVPGAAQSGAGVGTIQRLARSLADAFSSDDENGDSGNSEKLETLNKKILEKQAKLNRSRKLIEQGQENKLLKESGYSEKQKQIKDSIEATRKKAYKKLQNVRHDQIIESLNAIFTRGYATKAIKEIKVNKDSLVKYYGDALKNQTRTKAQLRKAQKNLATPPSTTTTATASNISTTGNISMGVSTQVQATQFEKQIQDWQEELKNESVIQYILLGDLVRLIFEKLLNNTSKQAKKMAGGASALVMNQGMLRDNLEKGVILLPDVEIDNLQKGRVEKRNLYYFPISVKHLRYIFAVELFGKNNTSFTLFQLIEKIAELLSVTRKRKEQVLNVQTSNVSFRLKKSTYPLVIDSAATKATPRLPALQKMARSANSSKGRTNYGIRSLTTGKTKNKTPAWKSFVNSGTNQTVYKIFTDNPSFYSKQNIAGYRYGIVLNIQKMRQTSAASTNVPTFIFGGSATGIIKSFNLNEYDDDDLQKFVMEETTGNADAIIPSMYSIGITTIMCPIFQLGMDVNVLSPTINSTTKQSGIFIAGKYAINKITHSYGKNGFTTSIEGHMYSSPDRIVDAALNKADNRDARVAQVANQIYSAVAPDIKLLSGAPTIDNLKQQYNKTFNPTATVDSIQESLKTLESK